MTNNNQDVLDEFEKQFEDEYYRYVGLGDGYPRTKRKFLEDLKAFISQKLTERTRQVIEESAETPEHWNQWSIERQLGYNQAILNFKKQLKSRFLDQEVGEKE